MLTGKFFLIIHVNLVQIKVPLSQVLEPLTQVPAPLAPYLPHTVAGARVVFVSQYQPFQEN